MAEELKLIGDAKLDGKLVEGHIQKEQIKIERGAVGQFLGSSSSVPRNVAAIIAVFAAVVLIVAVAFWAGKSDFSYKDAVAALSSLITLSIGYLFGRSSKD